MRIVTLEEHLSFPSRGAIPLCLDQIEKIAHVNADNLLK